MSGSTQQTPRGGQRWTLSTPARRNALPARKGEMAKPQVKSKMDQFPDARENVHRADGGGHVHLVHPLSTPDASTNPDPQQTPPPTGLPDGAPRPAFADLTLADWLRLVKQRGYRLELVEEGVVVLAPPHGKNGCAVTWRDYVALKRWQHALQVAVARTHPTWWAYAAGKTTDIPALADIPSVEDAFACAACGGPADSIDQHALAHCAEHHPSTGWPA